MQKLWFIIVLWGAKFGLFLCKLLGKNGTYISGAFALKLQKNFITHFTNVDPEKTVFITGTNGKSTSNNLIVHALRHAGLKVTTNLEGANLITGVATALIRDSSLLGRVNGDYLIFETDERFFRKFMHNFQRRIFVSRIFRRIRFSVMASRISSTRRSRK